MTKRGDYEAPALTLVLVGQGVRATGADNSPESNGEGIDGFWE